MFSSAHKMSTITSPCTVQPPLPILIHTLLKQLSYNGVTSINYVTTILQRITLDFLPVNRKHWSEIHPLYTNPTRKDDSNPKVALHPKEDPEA